MEFCTLDCSRSQNKEAFFSNDSGLLAFEVKLAAKLRQEDTKELRLFLADYPMAKAYLVYCGDHIMQEDDIAVLPIAQCLKALPDLLQNPSLLVTG